MKTYLSHSLSMAMMPKAACQVGQQFSWNFTPVDEEDAFALIREAQNYGVFENYLVLPMMDSILGAIGQTYGVDLLAPRPKGYNHIALEPGDRVLLLSYSGRKLRDNDRALPDGATLSYSCVDVDNTTVQVNALINNL
jgi:hypothetical protein